MKLLRRQTTLESRATALSGIADPTTTGSIRPATHRRQRAKTVSNSLLTPHLLDSGTSLEPDRASSTRRPANKRASGKSWGASRLRSIASNGARRATLGQMQARYEGKARQVRGVLASLGLKLDASAGRDRRPVRAGKTAAGKPKF